jgi:hypothetical protein
VKADATCSRCGAAFHCGANDRTPCWCTALHVEPVTLARLAAERQGCLCERCLGALATPRNNSGGEAATVRD